MSDCAVGKIIFVIILGKLKPKKYRTQFNLQTTFSKLTRKVARIQNHLALEKRLNSETKTIEKTREIGVDRK